MKKMRASSMTLPLILFLFLITCSARSCSHKRRVTGYGYRLASVSLNPSRTSFRARLPLIHKSPIYGSDIQSLDLIARQVLAHIIKQFFHMYKRYLCNIDYWYVDL